MFGCFAWSYMKIGKLEIWYLFVGQNFGTDSKFRQFYPPKNFVRRRFVKVYSIFKHVFYLTGANLRWNVHWISYQSWKHYRKIYCKTSYKFRPTKYSGGQSHILVIFSRRNSVRWGSLVANFFFVYLHSFSYQHQL